MKTAIVGAGARGLSIAYHLKKFTPDEDITLIEAENWGGVIASDEKEGCVLEHGPETYQARVPLLHKLSAELGIADKLISADKSSKKRFIYKEGHLLKAPTGPLSLLTSSLFFFPVKFRIFTSLKKNVNIYPENTFFEVAKNLFGEPFAEYVASPAARGIFGTEAEELEFAAAFPKIAEAINKESSLKKAMKAFAAERRQYWLQQLGEEAFNGFEKGLYSFKGGLSVLTDALKTQIRDKGVKLETARISGFNKSKEGYTLLAGSKKSGPFERVIFTTSPSELAEIFKEHDKELSKLFNRYEVSAMTVVHSVWSAKGFKPDGFGYLIPRKEKQPVLGTLFSSRIFKEKAPADKTLTKTMIGGDSSVFSDDDLAGMVYDHMNRLFGVKEKPLYTEVKRIKPGLPKYGRGYAALRRETMQLLEQFNGIDLSGWHFDGIGLPDAIEGGYQKALELAGKYE